MFAVRRSSTGEAITSSTAAAARNELTGRRITAPVVRCQKPPPDGLPVPNDRDPPAIDVRAEQVEQRRQEGGGGQHRNRDDDHGGCGHRLDGPRPA